ncbi:MAG: HEPN domain-containing protein [Candidatus Thorarchaeota archaeon]|nr:HEPN domain-containing protein [Candidatus Thorarchaeota archaeon]
MRNDISEAARWLAQAEDELRDARLLADQCRFYLALYLSQQSAERALKAFLYSRGIGPLLTHSVALLIETAAQLDSAFSRVARAKRLDDYYIPTRYPNGLPGGIPSRYFDDAEEVEEAIGMSESIMALVKERTEESSH